MKCNYCGTTIPEGNKKCNGCGKKITIFFNIQSSKHINNNYKVIDNYNKPIQNREQKIERLLNQSKLSVDNTPIQDKNAISATILSIIGIMFIPFGIIFIVLALNKAKQITNPIEKEKTLRVVKILLAVSVVMSLFLLFPIIFTI